MGFLGDLFKKSAKSDGLDALKEKVEANPNDARLAQDLANQLKAQGLISSAQEYARRAAQAHLTAGFATKALAVLKGAVSWGDPSAELLQELVNVLLELKHKEDARGTLIQLRKLHASAGNKSELGRIDAQLTELGPGR
jgi:tetratricopeptide (TPR) repeat protein